jgi:hypothetical protein
MFNNLFKTTVRRLVDLPWPDLRDLFSWEANGTIQAENKNLLVAKASNTDGKTIGFVCAENVLLVDSFVLSPDISPNEAASMGNPIDAALASHANVCRMLIVIPNDAPQQAGEKRIRVVERKVYQQSTTPQLRYEIKQQTAYIN